MEQEGAFVAGTYDVAVVGAGHAGCEAAHACAVIGLKTILFTLSLDSPCKSSVQSEHRRYVKRPAGTRT